MSKIHPTAVIDPAASVHESSSVGAYAVIDAHVDIGADCEVGPHVHLTGHTTIGTGNIFHTGAVIGDAPQDTKYDGIPTRLRIGNGNTFREHVTVHRSNTLEEDTVIGGKNFFMAHSHVGHNCVVGDDNTFANAALLGGHVVVGDGVFISAYCGVHQFVRIGSRMMMQGHGGASKDMPPFTMASEGLNNLCGLNTVGMRRAGVEAEERKELKALYHRLFLSGGLMGEEVKAALAEGPGERAREMLEFIAASKRGVSSHGRSRGG